MKIKMKCKKFTFLQEKGANYWSSKIILKPKMKNLLGNTVENVPKFSTKKWIEVHDQSDSSYNTCKQIRFKTLI